MEIILSVNEEGLFFIKNKHNKILRIKRILRKIEDYLHNNQTKMPLYKKEILLTRYFKLKQMEI